MGTCFVVSSAWGQSGFSGYAAPASGSTATQPASQPATAPMGQFAQPTQAGPAPAQQSTQPAATQPVAQPQEQTPTGSGGYISTPNPNQTAQGPSQPTLLPPPFELSQNDQFRLNEFLSHWENFGKGIKRVSCNVHVREFDGGVFNQASKVPMSHTWGQFRYISPNKLLYHIRGEYSYIAKTGEEPQPEWKASSNESKIVYDGKSLTQYDFRKKLATVFPIVEEEWNDDLSMDGPFPLFFIANAKKLQDRFYLRIVTPADKVQTDVWIEAFPRYPGDAREFKSIIVLLRLSDLQPYHLRRTRINGKSYSDLEFQDVTINKGFWNIEASVDLGWKKATEAPISLRQRRMTDQTPTTASGTPVQTAPGSASNQAAPGQASGSTQTASPSQAAPGTIPTQSIPPVVIPAPASPAGR
ncbi:MAG: hypothetical protein PHQ75_11990 [Thermoguttaceae bacterium]|nr:hypothetical protein [Thermoguttaceae bacterium]